MKPSFEVLMKILRVAYDTSFDGEGISLHEALKRINYVDIQDQYDAQDLLPIINSNQNLINQWVLFSENKRTDGGYYLDMNTIGDIESMEEIFRSDSQVELVARYVKLELDFWAKFQ